MNPFFKALSIFTIIFYGSSCASLTGLEDGRSLGTGGGEIMGNVSMNKTPSFTEEFTVIDTTIGGTIPSIFYPNAEIGFRYGLTDKLDIRARLNLTSTMTIGAKYQLLGDRESKFALSAGADVGNIGFGLGLWNVQVPIYASYHPVENFTLYGSPRYVHFFNSPFDWIDGSANYLGANAGLLIGSKHKFGLDVSYYKFGIANFSANYLSLTLGGKFLIMESDDNGSSKTTSSNKKKKKR